MAKDWAYIRRRRKQIADPACALCDGDGNDPADDDLPCVCVFRAGDFSEPDPLADETSLDARELARGRR